MTGFGIAPKSVELMAQGFNLLARENVTIYFLPVKSPLHTRYEIPFPRERIIKQKPRHSCVAHKICGQKW